MASSFAGANTKTKLREAHAEEFWTDRSFFDAMMEAAKITQNAELRLARSQPPSSRAEIDELNASRTKKVEDALEAARKFAWEVEEHIASLRPQQETHQSDADVARDLQRSLAEQCQIDDEDARVARRLQDAEDVRATRASYAWEVGESLDGLRSPRLKHQSDADVARDLHEKSQAEQRQIDADHEYARSLRDA